MAKPTDTIDWATDANYANGPDVGTATKVEPSAGEKAEGWISSERPPAQWMNWILNVVHQWIAWANSLGIDVSSGEIVYDTPKTRTIMIPLHSFRTPNPQDVPTDISHIQDVGLQIETSAGFIQAPLHIPNGSTLTQVRMGVDSQNTGGTQMGFIVRKTTPNKSTPTHGTHTTITTGGGTPTATNGTPQVLTRTSINEVINNATTMYWLQVRAGDGAGSGTPDVLMWVEVTFTDPALRND